MKEPSAGGTGSSQPHVAAYLTATDYDLQRPRKDWKRHAEVWLKYNCMKLPSLLFRLNPIMSNTYVYINLPRYSIIYICYLHSIYMCIYKQISINVLECIILFFVTAFVYDVWIWVHTHITYMDSHMWHACEGSRSSFGSCSTLLPYASMFSCLCCCTRQGSFQLIHPAFLSPWVPGFYFWVSGFLWKAESFC